MSWKQVYDFNFKTDFDPGDWIIEGSANVLVTKDNELLIDGVDAVIDGQEICRSTVWYKEPVWGNIRFEMEIRGEDNNGNIWFFNTRPLKGHKTIFEWPRPKANYVDYTGDDRMEMYTLGILRSFQDEINFRYLGGSNAELVDQNKVKQVAAGTDPDKAGVVAKDFEEKTIFHSVPTPFDDPDRWYGLEIEVIENRITVKVDGKDIIDYTDPDHVENPLKGGYFGFRNFRSTKTWCRKLVVSVQE